MESALAVVLAGLQVGAIYALVGLSYVVLINATGILNFGQGEWLMVAAMLGLGLITIVALTLVPSAATQRPVPLKLGDQAPPFTLIGSDGRTYSLADYRGKQVVVLAWFAKAFTSG